MVSVTELDDDPRGANTAQARSSRGAGTSSRFGSSPTDAYDDYDDAIEEEERPDLYAVLGVEANATERDIVRAYRMKAMEAHPDRRRGAGKKDEDEENSSPEASEETEFSAISAAYGILSDKHKRAFYDAGGSMQEMDVEVDEYLSAFWELFEERFGGEDGIASIAEVCAHMSPAELATMPPFPFPKHFFPEGTFPEGLRFDEETFVAPPKVRAFIEEHGEAALAELATELAGAKESKRPSHNSRGAQVADEEEELRAFIMDAMKDELDDLMPNELPEGLDMDAAMAELLRSMQNMTGDLNGISQYDASDSSSDDSRYVASYESTPRSSETFITSPHHWIQAAKAGELDALQTMLGRNPELVYEQFGGIGNTGAHWLAARGHLKALKWFVEECEFDLDYRNGCGSTVLHSAASNGHEDCVMYLLSRGAKRDARDEFGDTPGDVANMMDRSVEIIEALGSKPLVYCGACEPESTLTPIEEQSESSIEEVREEVPEDEPTVITLEKDEQRKWLDFAKAGDLSSMKDMFEKNPDLLYADGTGTSYGFSGNTAMHWAASKGHEQCITWLCERGMDPNVTNKADSTPLHSAAGAGQITTLRTLIHACGASPTIPNDLGETPMDVAIAREHHGVALCLKTCAVLDALRDEFSKVGSFSLKNAKDLINSYAVDDPSYLGLTEKPEIIAKVRDIVLTLPDKLALGEPVQRPKLQGALTVTKPDETLADKSRKAKERGNELFAAGNYDMAIKSYSMAIRLDRGNHVLHSNRSAAYAGAGRFEDALSDAETCVKLAPDFAKGYLRHAVALSGLGQHAESAKVCAKGLKKDPESEALSAQLKIAKDAILDGERRYKEMWGDDAPSARVL